MSYHLESLLTREQREQAAAADAAQHRWDNAAPDECFGDEDYLTPDQAVEQATDELLSNADAVSFWLSKVCDGATNSINTLHLLPGDILDAGPAVLLACLMTGNNDQVVRAAHVLRHRAVKGMAGDISSRAAELLRGQA